MGAFFDAREREELAEGIGARRIDDGGPISHSFYYRRATSDRRTHKILTLKADRADTSWFGMTAALAHPERLNAPSVDDHDEEMIRAN